MKVTTRQVCDLENSFFPHEDFIRREAALGKRGQQRMDVTTLQCIYIL